MAQPDITSILAALAQQNQGGTPQASATPQQPPPFAQPPLPYLGNAQSPPIGAGYLPQPSNSGSVDLSSIKPSNSGSVSIADAIAKAKSIAANRGVPSYESRPDQRRGFRSRSRSRSPGRGYGGNPYRDERRDDRGRSSGYRRTPSPDRGRGQGGGDSNVETIRVKSSLVGLIIGRNGENLRRVESESGARVQFVQAKDAQQAERQCTISGAFRAREDAKQAIYTIIEENGGSNIMNDRAAYAASNTNRAKANQPALRDGEHTVQMLVPDKTVGLIIGRGGETIKDVQEKSGCHVNIVGENKSINGQRPVNLIGTAESTRIAQDLILEIVDSDNRAQQAAGAGNSNAVPASRDRGFEQFSGRSSSGGAGGDDVYEEKTIKVPSEAVGMIIGKGGETIKELQRSSGCKINVNQPKPPDITRDIDLAGTRRSMQAAERVIWEKVKTVRDRDEAAGRGGRSGGSNNNYDSAPPPQQQYGYQQQTQQAAPAYGYAVPTQAPQPAYQVPYFQQQSTPAPSAEAAQPAQMDPALYAQLYAQYMAQMANQGGQPGPQ
ncbi:hypothetical protein AMS68_003037 [Peltaster fructicola]|uniref:K Homology domain-containing protein n=1 Tax=Peltaster fructicola TaxID=286661 RepID=A0A6H0XSS9_9PEZI|nr:hypothetical protein AMS68_003037 [Peltaster fructicola]